MTRSKKSTKSRNRKFLKYTKGFLNRRKNVYKIAKQAYKRSLYYRYLGFKKKKRYMKRIWIEYLNKQLNILGTKYNHFIYLTKNKIILDKNILYIISKITPLLFKKYIYFILDKGC